jgi:putative ABC transport system substrate-binding protein
MRRREFLACLGVFASSPICATDRVRRLAIITPGTFTSVLESFTTALAAGGFEEGKNLRIERYFAQGSPDRLRDMVAEVVASRPDVIFALSGRTVQALKTATSAIPIVGLTSDPLSYGIVQSLSHPGGNITGTVIDAGAEVWGKRLEVLKEIAPASRVIFHIAPASAWDSAVGAAIRAGAAKLGLALVGSPVESPYDDAAFRRAFDSAISADAAVVNSAPELGAQRNTIIRLAEARRLPTMYPLRHFVDAGGLMTYDVNLPELLRHVATQIAEVLRGTPVGNIPYYQSTRFSLILNLKAAAALQLTIPPALLARADEVIE